ncbi:MAG: HupE/UreJ family protein [Halioglobus sp.]|nr:HupE/UreJ family protein [Halioglobus sp.]
MRRLYLPLIVIANCFPQLALGHTVEGVGKFYGGMLHSTLAPAHALALFTFALFVGQRGVTGMQFAYPAFLSLLAVGLVLAGLDYDLNSHAETALLVLATLFGIVVALNRQLPVLVYSVCGAALGMLVGLDSGTPDFTRQETALALLGCWVGDAIILILLAGAVELLRKPWQHIAVRVAASWGAASAILVLAMAFR